MKKDQETNPLMTRRDALVTIASVAAVSLSGCTGGVDEEVAADGGVDGSTMGNTDTGAAEDTTSLPDAEADTVSPDAAEADAEMLTCDDRTGHQTEGPFYPGEPEVRMDITEERPGVALALDIMVVAQGSCAPLASAEVDVWSADANGDYSGYDDFDTEGETWLRGQQSTDVGGMARFTTIMPGSYRGRAAHIHVKIRAEGRRELTTQVYFDDSIAATVLATEAYEGGAAHTLNGDDGFYAEDTLTTTTGDVEAGYSASIVLVV